MVFFFTFNQTIKLIYFSSYFPTFALKDLNFKLLLLFANSYIGFTFNYPQIERWSTTFSLIPLATYLFTYLFVHYFHSSLPMSLHRLHLTIATLYRARCVRSCKLSSDRRLFDRLASHSTVTPRPHIPAERGSAFELTYTFRLREIARRIHRR